MGAGIGAAVNGYSFPTAIGKVFSGFMRKNQKSGNVFDPLKFISRQPDGKTVGELTLFGICSPKKYFLKKHRWTP